MDDQKTATISRLAHAILNAPPPSPATIRQAKLLLLDAIGCGLLGAREAVSQSVVKSCAQSGECLVIGRRPRASIADAILLNGVAIRALDFNDYFVNVIDGEPETGGHPSDNIPVALAFGAVYARTGVEILAGIVVGYELYARLQSMMDRDGNWDGVSASGIVAPAIAGRLTGLTESQMAHALALGISRAPTPAIVRREKLSATKTIANALVAQSGAQAALLAANGITGPLSVLDSKLGLTQLFAHFDPDALLKPFSSDGTIARALIKSYPCVNTAQGVVAAALELHTQLKAPPQSLSQIELVMPDYRIIARQQNDPSRTDPMSREAADHSFPFLAAVTLIDGAFGLAQFNNERWRDPKVISLMEKISMRRDRAISAHERSPFPCRIKAVAADGREFTVHPEFPHSSSAAGLNEAVVVEKFDANLRSLLPKATLDAIVDAVMELDKSQTIEKISAALSQQETVL